jgi:hypothetical protein
MTNQIFDEGSVVFQRDDGGAFYVILDDGYLFVHACAPEGLSGSLHYEGVCGNEGRLRIELRSGMPPQEIRRRP